MKTTLALIALLAASSVACSDEMRSPTASSASSTLNSTAGISISPAAHPWNSSFVLTVTAIDQVFPAGAHIEINGALPATTRIDTMHLSCTVPSGQTYSPSTDSVEVWAGELYLGLANLELTNPPAGPYSVSPASAALGAGDTTLTITGQDLAANVQVSIDGVPLEAEMTYPATVTAVLTAAQITQLGSGPHTLTVLNPAPGGGGPAGTPFTIH